MKNPLLCGVSALVLTMGSVQSRAADDVTVPIDTARFNWSGSYIGVFASYSHTTWHAVERSVPSLGSFTGTIDSWGGGGVIGYNFQDDDTVYGIEADGEFLNGIGNYSGVPGPGFANASVEWTASIRGRLGKDMGQYLPYLLAGVSWAYADTAAIGAPPNQTDTHVGFVVGAGVDMKLGDDGGFARLEYNYADYSEERYVYCPTCLADESLSRHSVRIGIGKFF